MTRPLTTKQETFCLQIFEGKTGAQAAIEAGYAFGSAAVTACRLLIQANIIARLAELRQKAEDESIATVKERKQILTAILRGRLANFIDKDLVVKVMDDPALKEIVITRYGAGSSEQTSTTVKIHDPIAAIRELNKMEGIGGITGIMIDNRTVNITVASPKGESLTKRIMAGEGTGLIIEAEPEEKD